MLLVSFFAVRCLGGLKLPTTFILAPSITAVSINGDRYPNLRLSAKVSIKLKLATISDGLFYSQVRYKFTSL